MSGGGIPVSWPERIRALTRGELDPVALQLYWTLYTGVLMFWAQDRSRKQEDTLALLDESMAMFAGWLQREGNREMKGGEDSCPQP